MNSVGLLMMQLADYLDTCSPKQFAYDREKISRDIRSFVAQLIKEEATRGEGNFDIRLSISQMQVLKSELKERLRAMDYDPDNPDVDGIIIESIWFEVAGALKAALHHEKLDSQPEREE